jgi:hypothetical protein
MTPMYQGTSPPNQTTVYERVAAFLREKYGIGPSLTRARVQGAQHELEHFVLASTTPSDRVLDVVDAFLKEGVQEMYVPYREWSVEEFAERVRSHFSEQRMVYDLVEGRVVPKSSDELHASVVVPALTLLHGRSGFQDVEGQYRDALRELSEGHWADAVTDANAAAEHTLRKLLGFEQGQLPDLLAEARKRGWFGEVQAKWLKKATDGLSALAEARNVEGDAHQPGTADEALGWLAVHWAGALIVYLLQRVKA